MAQQLRAFVLSKNLGSIPSTPTVTHNHQITPVPGDSTLYSDLHKYWTYTQAKSFIYIQ
ncbi:mCG1050992 [Mus musculus]|nr:mCG1050992 [Mus musculus]